MAATQLRTKLLRELAPIFDSEPAMTEAIDALRRIRITYLRVPAQPKTASETTPRQHFRSRKTAVKDGPFPIKPVEQLSPILQEILNMPRTGSIDPDDINGDQIREEYLKEKYGMA